MSCLPIIRCPGISYNLYFDGAGRLEGPRSVQGYTTYLAIENDNVLGALLVERWHDQLYSNGTLVRRPYRRRGIAKQLWEAMLEYENPKTVRASMVSDLGRTLIDSLKKKHPTIKWVITEDGFRKLRRLKGKRRAA